MVPSLLTRIFPPGFSIVVKNPPLPVHFDDQEHTWVDGAFANAIDIESVALHEIGHCLGMLHTTVNGSVMFPTINQNSTSRSLQPDDVAGVYGLYPTGLLAISSEAFPGTYLRMDGRGGFTIDGGGIVNCQHNIGAWEKFRFTRA